MPVAGFSNHRLWKPPAAAAIAAYLQRVLHPLARIRSVSAITPLRLRLIGAAVGTLTLALAGLIAWDLNRRSLAVAAGEIRALDLALAQETSRYLQVINQLLQRAESRVEA